MNYNSFWFKIYEKILKKLTKVSWETFYSRLNGGRKFDLNEMEQEVIRNTLNNDHFIILTYRKTHLSSYLLKIANIFKTGKTSNWSHTLLSINPDELVEATGRGVHKSDFSEIFNCDSVALLKPKRCSFNEFTVLLDIAIESHLGKPYDNLFNLNDDSRMSCVELVRDALRVIPGYEEKFPCFEDTIRKYGNLTPQMIYDCSDFEVVLHF